MNINDEVRPGGNRYVSGTDVIKDLPEYLAAFKDIAIVTGDVSYQVFNDYYQEELPFPIYRYDGSASYENAQEIANQIGKADVIVGIGGGRVCDTAKLTAEDLNCDVILVPTLISNCAPFTPITAVYYPNRTFRCMGFQSRAPYLTLVDWQFLLATPREYFEAGIGDTLAKWYEIEGITRRLKEEDKSAYTRLGIACAKEIAAILFEDSQKAINSLNQQTITPAFARVADTIVALAGETGGFAVSYGRSAGAHAVHDGLSYLEETHKALHGKKVAYGVLVQLAYTNDFDEISKILPFYEQIGLPNKLAQMSIENVTKESLAPVIQQAAAKDDTFPMIDPEVTEEQVFAAIQAVEAL
ncbi:iron-containing alcohol dehydrogenase family protein [Tetragenococcus halophilus]|uniref:iron-containing alcohol dehydrogenase family protein n=1 Tax=Tetragenococcus halophilus TaxID=51669 RepID=UPI001F47CED9|nr:iron-containing alcohol dehydrogenase family protein [Tetragenococcus halophilus]MCF1684845.1 iron-containing alcohol dehydrogenase family protein [Tetragenococcus halophilus]